MKKLILGTAFVFAVVLASAVFSGCTKEPGTIYGIVTTTGEPLKGIGVSLFSGKNLLLKTVTYDDGHYEFTDLTPGEYLIVVEAEGYQKFTTSVIVESGRQARADMQITHLNTYMTVITNEPHGTDPSSVTFYGGFSCEDGYEPNECGFYYSTSTPPTNGTQIKAGDPYRDIYNNWTFRIAVSNLSRGVTYYIQAYAKNSIGLTLGDVKTVTFSNEPSVKTLTVTNVAENSATLNGEILFAGIPAFTERGFVYSSTFENPTIDDPASSTTKVVVSGTSTSFSANIDNLTENATYHVRAFITNANGTTYGESVPFIPSEPNYIAIPSLGLMIQKYDLSAASNRSGGQSLCNNSTVGGYTDWRLPTVAELQAIDTYGESVNWDDNLVGVFDYSECFGYWSSEDCVYSSGDGYVVKIGACSSSVEVEGCHVSRHIRAVRNL